MFCRSCGAQLNDDQAVCLKCGVEKGNGKGYCPNCGNAVVEEAVICVNCGASLKKEDSAVINTQGIRQRSIVKAIVFSVITLGIYAIYWFVCLTNEINQASGRTADTRGGVAFLLSLVTCGIYEYYWAYKLGEKRDVVAKEKGSSNIIYLVLALFGFVIVAQALAQDALNKAIDKK
jgi:nitrate reductase NapE component